MKKILLLALCLSPAAFAQVNNPTIIAVSTAPSGSCTSNLPIQLKTPDGTLYTCQNGAWGPASSSGGSGGVVPTNICTAAGMKCDGVTDDTAAFQTLINTTSTAGGGVLQGPCGKTLLQLGQITIPSSGTTPFTMSPLRITGCTASFGASNLPTPTPPGHPFIIDARFAGSRILSLGLGTLEIDHLTLINGGTNCGTFLQTTLTNVKMHDNAILGNTAAGGTSSCDDVWLAGGTNGTNIALGGTVNDYFQGYGSVVRDNFADYIRSFLIGRVAFNSVPVTNNEVGINSGSNATTAISAATNATAAVLTSTAHSLPVGTGVTLTFSGFTGNWTPLNGAHAITVIDANTFSVAVNSSAFGALTGTPVYLSGSAFSIDGTAASGSNFTDSGNFLSGNLVEQTNYPFAYTLGVSGGNYIGGASCWDATTVSVACVWQQTAATPSFIQLSRSGSTIAVLSQTGASANSSIVYVSGQLQSNSTQFQPSLATNGTITAQMGVNGSNFNNGSVYFKFVGSGSTSNQLGLFIQGGHTLYTDGNGAWNITSTQTTVNCTTGSVIFSETHEGPSYKSVVVYVNGCTGTASYTYPVAFLHTPQLLSQSLTTSVVTSISTTAVTVTGSATTGFAKLDGF